MSQASPLPASGRRGFWRFETSCKLSASCPEVITWMIFLRQDRVTQGTYLDRAMEGHRLM